MLCEASELDQKKTEVFVRKKTKQPNVQTMSTTSTEEKATNEPISDEDRARVVKRRRTTMESGDYGTHKTHRLLTQALADLSSVRTALTILEKYETNPHTITNMIVKSIDIEAYRAFDIIREICARLES